MSLLTPVFNKVSQSLSKLRSRSLIENPDDSYIPPSGTVSRSPNDTPNDTLDLSTTPISSSLAKKWWYESQEEGASLEESSEEEEWEDSVEGGGTQELEGGSSEGRGNLGVDGSKLGEEESILVVEGSKLEECSQEGGGSILEEEDSQVVKGSKLVEEEGSLGEEGSQLVEEEGSLGVEGSKLVGVEGSQGVDGGKLVEEEGSQGVKGSKLVEEEGSQGVNESKLEEEGSQGVEGSKLEEEGSKGVEGANRSKKVGSKKVEGSSSKDSHLGKETSKDARNETKGEGDCSIVESTISKKKGTKGRKPKMGKNKVKDLNTSRRLTRGKSQKGENSIKNKKTIGCETCGGEGCCYVCHTEPCDYMIGCSSKSCKGPWAHYACVNMTEDESKEFKQYYCQPCQSENPKRKNIKYKNQLPKMSENPKKQNNPSDNFVNQPDIVDSPVTQPDMIDKPVSSPENPKIIELASPLLKTPEKRPEMKKTLEKQYLNRGTQIDNINPELKKVDDSLIAGLVSNFSKEIAKAIQQNTNLKTIIQSLEEELSKNKLDANERKNLEKLQRENLLLISSVKEKDAYILNMEKKLEDTVEKLQYTHDQLDVATIDLQENHQHSKQQKLQKITDTKEKHLKEKTEMLNRYKDALEKNRKENEQLKKEIHHLSNTHITNKLLHVAITENADLIKEMDIEREKVQQLNDQRKSDLARIDELQKINETLKRKIKDDSDDYETISDDSSTDENPPTKKDKKKNDNPPKNQDVSRGKTENPPPPRNPDKRSVCRFHLERRCRYGNSCWYEHPQDQIRPSFHGYDLQRQRYDNQNRPYYGYDQQTQRYDNRQNQTKDYRSNSASNYSSVPKNPAQRIHPQSPRPNSNQRMQPQNPNNFPPLMTDQHRSQAQNHPPPLMPDQQRSQPQSPPQHNRQSQVPETNIHQGQTNQNPQQMYDKNPQLLLNQLPLQMLTHQQPLQFLNQLPIQMFSQYPHQMLVNQPAVNHEMIQQILKNSQTLENSNYRPTLPEVNNLETAHHPEIPLNTNQA